MPAEVNRFVLDELFEQPIQATLVELLLLRQGERDFTSCVLVHGMGGTGKTVTAVAAVQEIEVRVWFSDIYWLTVGADAVGERIKQLAAVLYKQLSGKSMKEEGQDDHERQAMLVAAMADKQRALLVLDDPWMPEQVRFLNPIDGSSSQTEHRLLVTTRIRDLVPKATLAAVGLIIGGHPFARHCAAVPAEAAVGGGDASGAGEGGGGDGGSFTSTDEGNGQVIAGHWLHCEGFRRRRGENVIASFRAD